MALHLEVPERKSPAKPLQHLIALKEDLDNCRRPVRAARARGRNGGRPRKLKTKDIQAIKALMHAGELPVQDIADRFGVSRATLYRNASSPESPKALKTQTHAVQTASAGET